MSPLKIDFSLSYTLLFQFIVTVMDTLTDEIMHICSHLSDKDNIRFSATSKRLSDIKFRILFFTMMRINDIVHLSYFHQFSDVVMSDTNESLSKHVIHITFGACFNQPINSCIPDSITHLTFGGDFDQLINGCIPDSVSHLTFGRDFDQPIKDCISNFVTHLTFGYRFNQPINNCIPDSVTHLTFGPCYNQAINGCVPSSVTHLTFGSSYNQAINGCIPGSNSFNIRLAF